MICCVISTIKPEKNALSAFGKVTFPYRLCDSSVVPRPCCWVTLHSNGSMNYTQLCDSAQVSEDDQLTTMKHLDEEKWKLWVHVAALCASVEAAARGDGRCGRRRLLKAVWLHRVTHNICKSTDTLQNYGPASLLLFSPEMSCALKTNCRDESP